MRSGDGHARRRETRLRPTRLRVGPVLVVLFAVLAQLFFQPSHILHHLHDDGCHKPVAVRDDCSQCAVFHGGGVGTPAADLSIDPGLSIQRREISPDVGFSLRFSISPTSRAPPSVLLLG